jgi:acetylornithine aminotransferase
MLALTPGDGSDQAAQQLVMRLYALGLMGFIAGHDPARVRFLPPPGITTESEIDFACELIAQAVAS